MQALLDTLDKQQVPLTYLHSAVVTDLAGKTHTLSPLEYAALATRDRPCLFLDATLIMDGAKMAEALRHEMNAIYWPWGWAT